MKILLTILTLAGCSHERRWPQELNGAHLVGGYLRAVSPENFVMAVPANELTVGLEFCQQLMSKWAQVPFYCAEIKIPP